MKRLLPVILAMVLLVGPAWAKTKAPPRTRPAPKAVPKEAPEKQPPMHAFIVVEARTGQMLEGDAVHLRWPPASITKLMLALLVIEKLQRGEIKLTDTITISEEASRMGGSQVYLKPGETFPLEELMKAVLVASANDAAYAAGELIAGSREAVVEMMNARARELGMADTVFHSMHGLPPGKDQEPDLSSCHDLALLARELLKHPRILEWTSVRSAPFRDGTLIMHNHNRLLNRMDGMDGLKTGYYREAGFSVVATASRNGLRLIGIVLGSPGARLRDSIVEEKLRKWFAAYEMAAVVRKGEPAGKEIAVSGGKQKTVTGVASEDFSYPVARDKKKLLVKETVLPERIDAEVKAGQRLGEIVIRFNGEPVGKVDVVSPVHIEKSGFFDRIFK